MASGLKLSRKNGTKTEGVGPGRPPIETRFALGNPGRPKGSRNKLSEAFIAALCADFEEHGAETIARVREQDPVAYVRVVASLMPKEVKVDDARNLTDEQLDERINSLARSLGLEIIKRETEH